MKDSCINVDLKGVINSANALIKIGKSETIRISTSNLDTVLIFQSCFLLCLFSGAFGVETTQYRKEDEWQNGNIPFRNVRICLQVQYHRNSFLFQISEYACSPTGPFIGK
jgi:hypothetical protein